jgi:DNA replication and repair protein RecF
LHVKNIRLSGFRNLVEQSIELAEGLNLLVGENGQGKTNFLEAVYVLATLRSFRSASIRDVIRFEGESAEVSADIDNQGVPSSLRVCLSGSVRRLWMGNRTIHAAREYLGQLKVVAFTPDDLAMIKGGPILRRRFLDRAAFLFDPQHLERVKKFNHALKSRNRLLKEGRVSEMDELDSFSQTVAEEGSMVSRTRRTILGLVGRKAEKIIADMLPEAGEVRVSFKPGWEMGERGPMNVLLEQIRSSLDQDMKRRQTCLGPHQDDFGMIMGSGSARRFASQGQQRTAAIAMLLAVVQEVVSSGGEQPVILLDDVSSELDAIRRRLLFERIGDLGGQVLITTTEEGMVQDLKGREAGRFRVEGGRVRREEEK